ncbi:hypothetical protein evm_009059 [Chilo suppressalis]|nr:hypothetical protein evm_009059 [Chilo suppressalis]
METRHREKDRGRARADNEGGGARGQTPPGGVLEPVRDLPLYRVRHDGVGFRRSSASNDMGTNQCPHIRDDGCTNTHIPELV